MQYPTNNTSPMPPGYGNQQAPENGIPAIPPTQQHYPPPPPPQYYWPQQTAMVPVHGYPAPGPGTGILNQQPYYYPPTQNYPQPGANYPQQPLSGTLGKVRWSTGLFDCCDDVPNCCITLFCPCITFGRLANIIDQGRSSCAISGLLFAIIGGFVQISCITCICSCVYRSKLREQYMLEQNPGPDWCVHWLCQNCAMCQEYRELKNRGFLMDLGWEGNKHRIQTLQPMSAPVVQTGMKR